MPKPVAKYRALIANLEQLLNLFSGLKAIRHHVPRKVTVTDVVAERTELVRIAFEVLTSLHRLMEYAFARKDKRYAYIAPGGLALAIVEGARAAIPASFTRGSRGADSCYRESRRVCTDTSPGQHRSFASQHIRHTRGISAWRCAAYIYFDRQGVVNVPRSVFVNVVSMPNAHRRRW